MSKTDTIQRVQALLEEVNEETDEDILYLFDISSKIFKEQKSNFQNIMKYTKEKLDNLQFSENFEKKKREYFNKNI